MNKSFNTSTSKHYKASLAKRAGLVLLVFLGLASQSNSQSFDWGLYNAGDPGWISASVNKNGNFFFMGSANEGMDIDGFSFTGASQYVMMVNHSGHVEFLKKTSDDINSLVADNNDNFFMAFDMPFIAGNPFYIDDDTIAYESESSKILLAKFDRSGKQLWNVQYKPETTGFTTHVLQSHSDEKTVMIADNLGNVYLYLNRTGNENAVIGDTSLSWNGKALLKFGPGGEFIYCKNVSGFTLSNMCVDAKNNLYLTGQLESYANKDYNICDFGNGVVLSYTELLTTQYQLYTAKFDPDGKALWAVLTSVPLPKSGINGVVTQTTDIVCDKNDAPHLVGYYNTSVVFNEYDTLEGVGSGSVRNAFIVKYNTDGSYQWAKTYVDVSTKYKDSEIRQLRFGSNNDIYLFCLYIQRGCDFFGNELPRNSVSGSGDRMLARLDSEFNLLWWKYITSGEDNNCYPRMAVTDRDEIYLTSGGFGSYTTICTLVFQDYYTPVEDSVGKGAIAGNPYFVKFNPGQANSLHSPTGLTEAESWPNPVENVLYIKNRAQADRLDIVSLNGQLLWSYTDVLPEKDGIRVGQLKPGLYFVRLYHDNKLSVLRFVKK